MSPPTDQDDSLPSFDQETEAPRAPRIKAEDVLRDFRAGMRTKSFLAKYHLTVEQFEQLLKRLIRERLISKEELLEWKTRRAAQRKRQAEASEADWQERCRLSSPGNVDTCVIQEPERNGAWVLDLFAMRPEEIEGTRVKVTLHGKKYAFFIEELLFRGQVKILGPDAGAKRPMLDNREAALEYIAQHGWAAYLETRAFLANFQDEGDDGKPRQAKLMLLRCKNGAYLAALHTPVPAVNIYVSSSLENLKHRIAAHVDLKNVRVGRSQRGALTE
jgi:hypothetical protein